MNTNLAPERCSNTEAEALHGAREDRREANEESLRASAPDMAYEAKVNLPNSESFSMELSTVCPLATARLAAWAAGWQDVLPANYAYVQMALDEGAVRLEINSWLEMERRRLVDEWIQEQL